ncbi:MAG: nucleoside triphosphate pyrophosphohydrolase [Gammaproteobacteria bacterium]|nr:nucleoside triphosphate pyrophosphohydrolase [Gammaproteobacteria bacterium]
MDSLLQLMARLRDPVSGCPWDLAQTFATIAPYTIEEAYEVADAIERHDMAELRDELGDLLLQVVFHARMAEEAGHFSFADVVGSLSDKLLRRHPHVFGDSTESALATLSVNWEAGKAQERAAKNGGDQVGALEGVARALPALMRAEKLQKRAARVGFDWQTLPPVIDKVREELAELETEIDAPEVNRAALSHEAGDLLFSTVNVARHLKLDAEVALRAANSRFERRFRYLERKLLESGQSAANASTEELERLWEEAKGQE